ncbi:Peptidylprolyl isomerase [Durusdinium trenchii]|uniref:Peptidylprolyl isomerase n=1 Tax=Durusdinium trenchii TaxID=1381693 RepID=A0ABP0QMK7_9DINO
MIVCCILGALSILLFLSRLLCRPPPKLQHFLAGLFGAPVGALATVQAIYFYWNSDGSEAPLVYGMVAGNRARWCSDPSSCKIFFCTFCILNIVSVITQLLIYSGFKEYWSDRKYAPVPFRHPRARSVSFSEVNGDTEEDDETWDMGCAPDEGSETWHMNLQTPRSCWIFLTAVVTLSCVASVCFTYFVKWASNTATQFLVALMYILTNAFCLWSIIEFFLLTLWFHTIRLVCGMPPLPKRNFREGLDRPGRTCMAYCLLSKAPQSSEECFSTALEAHLANLDPNMRITTSVVSVPWPNSVSMAVGTNSFPTENTAGGLNQVTGSYELVRLELDLRDQARDEIRKRLHHEMQVPRCFEGQRSCRELQRSEELQMLSDGFHMPDESPVLPAYTYLDTDYGKDGRKKGSECFGFSGNERQRELERRGMPDVELVKQYGSDPKNRYFYTMVLDSDTICPPGSIRTLIESAEHPANRAFGIINANLAVDYTANDADCTWHMWRNALMEVSTVNLVRGQFWIFNRTGFYGKGLIRNEMYISRLIGSPGRLVEALPIDILSHDTVEAKLLQPAVNVNVTLYEDVARNPISALSQSTRWMFGEVKNACYHPDGSYRGIISLLTMIYAGLVECKPREKPWIRWREVPCSVSAEYLSHTGFRLFHAGPGILLVNIATSLLAFQKFGLELQVLPVVGMYAFLFTVLALFIIPKGFLMFDKLPSLNLGKWLLCTGKSSKIGDGEFSSSEEDYDQSMIPPGARIVRDEDSDSEEEVEEEKLDRCSVLIRQLALALVEISLSILLFSPELIIGVVRLVRGAWAQVKGKPNWQPQDAEIQQNLSFVYVFRKTWLVFACGVAYLMYAIVCRMQDAVVYLLIVSWIMYPFTTYWMCLPVPEGCKKSFLWKWVMDVKRNQD